MSELREVFEMVTKQTEPDVDAWREQERRQRRTSRNRKFGALAVAAVIGLVAVVVVIRAVDDGTGTQPGGQSTPTTAEPIRSITLGALEPGRYVLSTLDPAFDASHTITIDVPDGYEGVFYGGLIDNVVFKNGLPETGVGLWAVGYVYADACEWRGTQSAISSGDELVAALAGQKGLRVSTPTDVTVDGYAGTFLEVTVPAQANLSRCSGGRFQAWTLGEQGMGARHLDNLGSPELMWILDVDGLPLVIDAPLEGASADVRAELVQLVESIQIDPR